MISLIFVTFWLLLLYCGLERDIKCPVSLEEVSQNKTILESHIFLLFSSAAPVLTTWVSMIPWNRKRPWTTDTTSAFIRLFSSFQSCYSGIRWIWTRSHKRRHRWYLTEKQVSSAHGTLSQNWLFCKDTILLVRYLCPFDPLITYLCTKGYKSV